jgi:hypothetical protein
MENGDGVCLKYRIKYQQYRYVLHPGPEIHILVPTHNKIRIAAPVRVPAPFQGIKTCQLVQLKVPSLSSWKQSLNLGERGRAKTKLSTGEKIT